MFKGLLFLLSDSRTPGFWLLLLLFFVPAAYSQNKTVPARKPAASSPFRGSPIAAPTRLDRRCKSKDSRAARAASIKC